MNLNGLSNLLAPLAPLGALFHVIFYEPVYNALMLIYAGVHALGVVEAFALAIILLTLILRGCLIPLTRKQLRSSREMQVLQPLLKELQAKYKSEPQRLMEEQRRLYKEHGVNPLSGCLPLLVQMPFLYAFYGALYTIFPRTGHPTQAQLLHSINQDIYPFLPHLQHVPDLHFLWLQGAWSLGIPDPLHILPILAGVLTFIQLRMAMPVRKKTPGQKDATSQATGMMMYIMPFFTVFIGMEFQAGLALYWTISTGFSAVQQYFINRSSSSSPVGGWGSLFVGVPGLEHLVPPPQDVAAPAVQRAAALNRVSGSGAAGSAALVAPQQNGGFFGGFYGRVRDQVRAFTEAQQSAAQQRPAGRNGNTATSAPDVDTGSEPSAEPASNGASATPSQRQRPRARNTGPVLIKPSTANASTTTGDTTGDAVDQAIRAGTDQRTAPEKEIARDGTGPTPLATNGTNGANGKNGAYTSNGANGANGANGSSGKTGANGKASANGTNGNGTYRAPAPKGNYSNNNKRANSGRRDSRAKGGR